ncbi:TetR/AcrR family transcriptional regulator [Marinomonas agarivorans]|nr:TetR/AcrR family transcriptional regulator [Marinomonas agarivorans]
MGRPRTFDEKQALLKAMNTFWAKGYDGASLKDLTKAMGISGPSMYAAFGDKRELYLKTIDLYADVDACEPVVIFETEPDIAKAVKGFLQAVIHYAVSRENGAQGCYLASCAIANIDEVEGVAERLDKAIHDTDTRLAARFDLEKQKGNLPSDFPSINRARLMYDMRQSYMFRGRAKWSKATLEEDLDYRVKMIISSS